jgi:hypothetical protein
LKMIILLLMCLTACSDKIVNVKELKPSAHGELLSEMQIAEMKLEKQSYDKKPEELKLRIKNVGDSILTFGVGYRIEINKDNSWYEVPFKDNIGFTLQAVNLKPSERYEQTIGFEILDFEMVPGKYRVLKEVNAGEKQLTLSAAFEIK